MGSQIQIVKNRTNKKFEFTCDGQVHIVPAHDTVALPDYIAQHGITKSVISWNPNTGVAIRALCLATDAEAEDEIEARVDGSEVIERDNPDQVKTIKFTNADLPKARISGALG
jgi:hypothetical protein